VTRRDIESRPTRAGSDICPVFKGFLQIFALGRSLASLAGPASVAVQQRD
jgi:hypothetical protein